MAASLVKATVPRTSMSSRSYDIGSRLEGPSSEMDLGVEKAVDQINVHLNHLNPNRQSSFHSEEKRREEPPNGFAMASKSTLFATRTRSRTRVTCRANLD